ncbi:MAG: RNA 2',3'-cyclic phosphodiesterase [Phycisphaerales bacterium]
MGVLRLFVAVYPTAEAARELVRALERLDLPPVATHRATKPDQLHMTVQFIGDTDERELAEVQESVERSAAGLEPFMLTPARLVTLPERGPPRLVAGVTDAPPGLLELQRRLASRLARTPRPKTGDRFLPHMTLCRFTRAAKAPQVDAAIHAGPFNVERVRLVRSVLRPEGAEHVEVFRVTLGGQAGLDR